MVSGFLTKIKQYVIVTAVITIVIVSGLIFGDDIGYREIAFVLLLSVTVMALFLDIWPVIMAAFFSALLWDYLFIPPRFELSIGTREDQYLLITYFIIAVLHAVLTAKIRKAQKEISQREEKANSIKYYNTLLNSLSHELRTPITTIIGASDNVLAKDNKLSDKDKHMLIEEISSAALRLNYQVENLLNMSRIETGVFKVNKDWCDVGELIYNTIAQLDNGLKNYPTIVSIPENFPLFRLDYGLMEEVLYNLLNNIAQHAPEQTSIFIKAECIEEKLLITIADTGNGFPEDEVEKVFEKFYRLKGARLGGTGLGLSIVKGFVEAQGGVIALRNLRVKGAEFAMTFVTEISYLSGLKNE